jgi:SH3-like domain-containing protein
MILLALLAAPAVPSHAPRARAKESVTIPLAAPVESVATVRGHILNCRASPSLDAEIIVGIPRDSHISVRSDKGEWRHVTTKKGKVCWVAARYISGDPEPQ